MTSKKKIEHKENDYSWVGWVFVIGIVIWFIIGSSNSNSEQIQQNKEDVASQFIEDIEDEYTSLANDAQKLVGDIDQGCVWQSDEISSSVGKYCSSNANMYYADIQNGNHWNVHDITYDKSDELNDLLDDIASQANTAYDNLLKKAQDSLSAYRNQCDWISGNISDSAGDECNGYINGLDHDTGDPFDASDYYEDS